MRIRSTKPEFWRSERVASVDWEDRFVLKGLESYVDDNGVGRHDLALIVGDLFARDLIREYSRTLARVSEAISRLADAGLLWLYEHENTPLLYVAFWEEIQRVDKPLPGRFPRPDGTMNYKDSSIRESLANPREYSRTFLPGTGEQGNRGTAKERETRARAEPIAPPVSTIPDDWEPNLTHRAKAKSFGVTDLDAAAEAFRDHALAQGRVLSNWDAGFSQWLANPKTRAAERERRTPNGVKPAASDAAYAAAQALKDEPARLELEA